MGHAKRERPRFPPLAYPLLVRGRGRWCAVAQTCQLALSPATPRSHRLCRRPPLPGSRRHAVHRVQQLLHRMTIRHQEELDGLATDVGHGRARPILTLQVVRAGRCIAGAVHFCEPNPSLQASDASARLARFGRMHVWMRCIVLVLHALIAMSSRRGSTPSDDWARRCRRCW